MQDFTDYILNSRRKNPRARFRLFVCLFLVFPVAQITGSNVTMFTKQIVNNMEGLVFAQSGLLLSI